MAKPHGLSTLIEAARFIEVGESLSAEKNAADGTTAVAAILDEGQHSETLEASTTAKGCLRHELQSNTGSDSSLSFHRSFHSSEEVRQDHNRMEKMRRRDMRKEFDDLKNRIPCLLKGKHSSVAVLQSAVEYIGELKELEKSLKSKHQLLHDQHKSLRAQLATLQQGHPQCTCAIAAAKSDVKLSLSSPVVQSVCLEGKLVKATASASGSRKRKRSSSDASTISADSPKMFIGNRDGFEVTEDDKLMALSKKELPNSTVCLSPTLSASSYLTVTTSTPSSVATPNNHASPNSESSSAAVDSGLMSPPESCTSSASRVSNKSTGERTPPAKEVVKTQQRPTARKISVPSAKNVVAIAGRKVAQQPPVPSAPESKKVTPKNEPNERSPAALPSPARPPIITTHQSTPVRIVGNGNVKPTVVVGKQLAATFGNDKPPQFAGKRKSIIPYMADSAKVLRQQMTISQSVNLSDPPSSSRDVQSNKQPVQVVEKRRVITATLKMSEPEKTAAPVSVPASNVGRSICVVAGAATATVTPITIVTSPVKPTQVLFLQPVGGTKICQPVVLLPAAPTATTANQVSFANKSVAIIANNINVPAQVASKAQLIRTGLPRESQLPASTKRSPIVVLRPAFPVQKSSPPGTAKLTVSASATSYPVISVLSPPATPNGVIYSTTTGQPQL